MTNGMEIKRWDNWLQMQWSCWCCWTYYVKLLVKSRRINWLKMRNSKINESEHPVYVRHLCVRFTRVRYCIPFFILRRKQLSTCFIFYEVNLYCQSYLLQEMLGFILVTKVSLFWHLHSLVYPPYIPFFAKFYFDILLFNIHNDFFSLILR